MSLLIGLILTLLYAHWFPRLHVVPVGINEIGLVVFWIGLGTLLRLFSDAAGAVLQTRGQIDLDNQLLASTDISWVIFVLLFGRRGLLGPWLHRAVYSSTGNAGCTAWLSVASIASMCCVVGADVDSMRCHIRPRTEPCSC